MATRSIITEVGFEFLGRFNARASVWAPAGYRLFAFARWGEGGFQNVGGLAVPRDPTLFANNTDLEIVENPLSYPGFGYGTARPGLAIDQTTEVLYQGGAQDIVRVIANLQQSEENVDEGGIDSPRLFEVGIFDNLGSMVDDTVRLELALPAGVDDALNNMIAYCTFDGFLKTNSRTVDIFYDIPFHP